MLWHWQTSRISQFQKSGASKYDVLSVTEISAPGKERFIWQIIISTVQDGERSDLSLSRMPATPGPVNTLNCAGKWWWLSSSITMSHPTLVMQTTVFSIGATAATPSLCWNNQNASEFPEPSPFWAFTERSQQGGWHLIFGLLLQDRALIPRPVPGWCSALSIPL